MSIWSHESTLPHIDEAIALSKTCMFCKRKMRPVREIHAGTFNDFVGVCPRCGWWCHGGTRPKRKYFKDIGATLTGYDVIGAAGALLDFDISASDIPIDTIREYLLVKFESRHELNPRLFEEVVASVYRDFGYSAIVTAYQKDGGVDIVLNKGEKKVAIQVKRSKNRISVEQLRTFLGALVCADLTTGIFVTTSVFTRDARSLALHLPRRGYKIDLVDAPRLLDALEIKRRPAYNDEEVEALILEADYSALYEEYVD